MPQNDSRPSYLKPLAIALLVFTIKLIFKFVLFSIFLAMCYKFNSRALKIFILYNNERSQQF